MFYDSVKKICILRLDPLKLAFFLILLLPIAQDCLGISVGYMLKSRFVDLERIQKYLKKKMQTWLDTAVSIVFQLQIHPQSCG